MGGVGWGGLGSPKKYGSRAQTFSDVEKWPHTGQALDFATPVRTFMYKWIEHGVVVYLSRVVDLQKLFSLLASHPGRPGPIIIFKSLQA